MLDRAVPHNAYRPELLFGTFVFQIEGDEVCYNKDSGHTNVGALSEGLNEVTGALQLVRGSYLEVYDIQVF